MPVFRHFFILGCKGGLSSVCSRDFEAENVEAALLNAAKYEQHEKFKERGGKVFDIELHEVRGMDSGKTETVQRIPMRMAIPWLKGTPAVEEKHRQEIMAEVCTDMPVTIVQ